MQRRTPAPEWAYRGLALILLVLFLLATPAQAAQRGLWGACATPTPTPTPPPSTSQLRITALQYSARDEYIEISNNGPGPQDMTDWCIQSVVGDQWFPFPTGYVLAPDLVGGWPLAPRSGSTAALTRWTTRPPTSSGPRPTSGITTATRPGSTMQPGSWQTAGLIDGGDHLPPFAHGGTCDAQ
jgi:hypothetical protein